MKHTKRTNAILEFTDGYEPGNRDTYEEFWIDEIREEVSIEEIREVLREYRTKNRVIVKLPVYEQITGDRDDDFDPNTDFDVFGWDHVDDPWLRETERFVKVEMPDVTEWIFITDDGTVMTRISDPYNDSDDSYIASDVNANFIFEGYFADDKIGNLNIYNSEIFKVIGA